MRTLLKGLGKVSLPLALCLGVLFMPDIALAQATGDTNESIKNFAQIAASLVHIISAIAILIMQFMPALWGSELITGVEVTNGLRTLWVYVRNLTNIAFVGMILFLAFSNLVTSGKGIKDWNIKSKLGPVILGLVAINFSLLAMRVLVDVVHVGTVALLSIADPIIEARGVNNVADYYTRSVDTETFEDCDVSSGGANCKPLREIVNSTFCASGLTGDSCLFQIKEAGELQAAAAAMGNPEKRNIMMAFGTFFMKLESLPLLSAESGGLLNVLDSTIFSIIFGLAYLLALIAIFIVLLIRVVMMWLFIIFSPVLVTSWVFGFQLPLIGDQFWKYLLVPLKAAGALAFGFVMLATLETMKVPKEIYVDMVDIGAPLKKFWGGEEFGGWAMIWKVLTVVLFWKVVFDFALKDIEGVSGITGAIQKFGTTAGSAALSYGASQVPVPLPAINGEKATLASFLSGGNLSPNRSLGAISTGLRQGRSVGEALQVGGENANTSRELGRVNGNVGTARNVLGGKTAAQWGQHWREERGDREEMIEAIRLINPNAAAGLNASDNNSAAVERVLAGIARDDNSTTSGTQAPTTTPTVDLAGTAKVEGTIQIATPSGGTQDIVLSSGINAGSNINAANLATAGITESVVNGLTGNQLDELATKIATQAGIPGKQSEILAQLQAIS